MFDPIRKTTTAHALAAALFLLPLSQDDPKPAQEAPPPPLSGEAPRLAKEDPHTEMKRLFGKIERELREIDRLLSDASAGAPGSTEAAEKAKAAAAKMDELLKKSEERCKSVVAGIDRILELADQPCESQSQCSGSGGLCRSSGSSGGQPNNRQGEQSGQPGEQQGSQSGQSPLDRQGEGQTERESTPGAPQKKPGGEGEERAEAEKDQGTPDGDRSSKLPAQNHPAGPPPKSASEPARSGASAIDKWGELPVHARDVFRAQGGGDMPSQYRDWIDAYYRRLSKRSGS